MLVAEKHKHSSACGMFIAVFTVRHSVRMYIQYTLQTCYTLSKFSQWNWDEKLPYLVSRTLEMLLVSIPSDYGTIIQLWKLWKVACIFNIHEKVYSIYIFRPVAKWLVGTRFKSWTNYSRTTYSLFPTVVRTQPISYWNTQKLDRRGESPIMSQERYH